MRKSPFVCSLALVFPLFCHANVQYTFSGSFNLNQTVTFTLTVPNYITATGSTGLTPDASFFPGLQLTCNACNEIDFFVDAVARGFTNVPSNTVGYGVGTNSYFFYFAPQSFTVNGTYTDVIGPWFSNQGTLTVSGTPVPEPATLPLWVSVAAGLGVFRRRILTRL